MTAPFVNHPTLDPKVVERTIVSQNTRQNSQYRGGWRALLLLPLIKFPDDEQLRRWPLGTNIKARIPSGVSYLVPLNGSDNDTGTQCQPHASMPGRKRPTLIACCILILYLHGG